VAEHLGTRHCETPVRTNDVVDLAPSLATIFDEPLADDSMIPITLLSRAARRDVTVALTGDGGDELFAGYDRYMDAARWLARRRSMPGPLRPIAAALARMAGPAMGALGWNRNARRLDLLGGLLADGAAEALSAAISSRVADPGVYLSTPGKAGNVLLEPGYCLGRGTDIDRFLFMDLGSFLIEDILAKVDRASMASSLEVRCPLLDYRLIEMSWRFPSSEKVHGAVGKQPLRHILRRSVPSRLIDRPKMGFNAPLQVWLRDGLRDWAEDLLSPAALSQHGLLNVTACRRLWEDFATRRGAWTPMIWSVLMFQAWHQSMTQSRLSSAPAHA
jgi:asparagine synthase (glutamine-hydrolysing)